MKLGVNELFRLIGPVLIMAIALAFVGVFILSLSNGSQHDNINFFDKLAYVGQGWANVFMASVLLGAVLAAAQFRSPTAAVSGLPVGKISLLAAPFLGLLMVVFSLLNLIDTMTTDNVRVGIVFGALFATLATSLIALFAARIAQLSPKA